MHPASTGSPSSGWTARSGPLQKMGQNARRRLGEVNDHEDGRREVGGQAPTIEELNTTNDDLQARSVELQESARSREQERLADSAARRHLEAILLGVGEPVLAVGSDGRILFSNDSFNSTFGDVEPGEQDAHPILGNSRILHEEGETMPRESTPQVRASRGESFEMRFAVEGGGGALRHFEARGRPIEDTGTGGGVVVIRVIEEGR